MHMQIVPIKNYIKLDISRLGINWP